MRVLVLEDDKALSQALCSTLERAGYAADCLYDGNDGLSRIETHHKDYDLLILDITLPGLNGDAICKSIREQGIKIPILVLSGKSLIEDKVNLLDLGADDYLSKPFSSEELLARVRALLRRPAELLPNEILFSDLSMNIATHKVYKSNKEVVLTLKEFGILEYLMRHPGQVVKRDQLLDHVWDFDFDSFSNIIDVHINNLRKKLAGRGKDGHNYVETVRGVGYRLHG